MRYLAQTIPAMIIAASSMLAAGSSIANEGDLARLDGLLQGIETMETDVVQLIVESDGGILEESAIKMYLKKPNGFYWETIEPFPELIVTDGVTLWNYQPDLEQVVIEDWDNSRSELASQLLSGQTENLGNEYTVELMTPYDSEFQEFDLTPIAVDSVYQQISINFVNRQLDVIHLDSRNGQQTVWRFENIIRNEAIEDDVFQFVPPENIEIIENSYTQ